MALVQAPSALWSNLDTEKDEQQQAAPAADVPLEQLACAFLQLPGELRNTIYRLLLTSPLLSKLRRLVNANHASSYVVRDFMPLFPALLRTCRQVKAEAEPILYYENSFAAHGTLLTGMPYLLNPQKPIMFPHAGRMIRKWYINVRLDCDARFTEQACTDAFSGAEELEVEAMEAMYRAAGNARLMLFKGVRDVGKAIVHGSVDDDFARWLEATMMSPKGTDIGEPESFKDGVEKTDIGGVGQVRDVWTHGNR